MIAASSQPLMVSAPSSSGHGEAAGQPAGTSQQPEEGEPILCNHCLRTANNGIRCLGMCVADNVTEFQGSTLRPPAARVGCIRAGMSNVGEHSKAAPRFELGIRLQSSALPLGHAADRESPFPSGDRISRNETGLLVLSNGHGDLMLCGPESTVAGTAA